MDHEERCVACGQPVDYCLGHGPLGDPVGAQILAEHEAGSHRRCHWLGCQFVIPTDVEYEQFLSRNTPVTGTITLDIHIADPAILYRVWRMDHPNVENFPYFDFDPEDVALATWMTGSTPPGYSLLSVEDQRRWNRAWRISEG